MLQFGSPKKSVYFKLTPTADHRMIKVGHKLRSTLNRMFFAVQLQLYDALGRQTWATVKIASYLLLQFAWSYGDIPADFATDIWPQSKLANEDGAAKFSDTKQNQNSGPSIVRHNREQTQIWLNMIFRATITVFQHRWIGRT